MIAVLSKGFLRLHTFFTVMPLITMTGIPLSGKTTRALELKAALEPLIGIRKVIVINEESLLISKQTAYKDGHQEKKCRGSIISAVERHLNLNDIIICDSLNYIKGFRYQLYCVARGLGTPSCTVYCGLEPQVAQLRNTSLGRYTCQFENLCSRYEEPDGRNRWDAPLFILINDDPKLSSESKMAHDIVNSLINKNPPAPNMSTVVKPIFETNYLHELDKVTKEVLDMVMEAQKNGRSGDLVIPNSSAKVCVPSRTVTIAELRRIKRQFMAINKQNAMPDIETISTTFAEYLTLNLE